MTRKLTRTGIAAIVMAGAVAAVTGGALPAQAAKPDINFNTETVYIYYSSASRTTVIGDRGTGCQYISWGSTSAYYSIDTYSCTPTTD